MAEVAWTPEPPPPRPSEHHVWSGWHWIFVQDVPRRSTPAAWLVGWLPRGHRHVWCATQLTETVWNVVNPASTHFIHNLESCEPGTYVVIMVSQGMTAARVGHWIDTRRPWFRGWLTCVTVAKMLTGARWWWVLTPGGLIREAERRGFEVVRPRTPA